MGLLVTNGPPTWFEMVASDWETMHQACVEVAPLMQKRNDVWSEMYKRTQDWKERSSGNQSDLPSAGGGDESAAPATEGAPPWHSEEELISAYNEEVKELTTQIKCTLIPAKRQWFQATDTYEPGYGYLYARGWKHDDRLIPLLSHFPILLPDEEMMPALYAGEYDGQDLTYSPGSQMKKGKNLHSTIKKLQSDAETANSEETITDLQSHLDKTLRNIQEGRLGMDNIFTGAYATEGSRTSVREVYALGASDITRESPLKPRVIVSKNDEDEYDQWASTHSTQTLGHGETS